MLGKVEVIAHSRFAGGWYLPAGERGGGVLWFTRAKHGKRKYCKAKSHPQCFGCIFSVKC